jgi:hypothetical protein
MATFSSLVGVIDTAAYYAALMARHLFNGVPTDTWLSLVNTGLSTTQYVSEALAVLRALLTSIFRAFFLEEWLDMLAEAETADEREAIEQRLTVVARNVYGIERQAPQLQLARFTLVSGATAPSQAINAGDVVGTLGDSPLLWAAEESATLDTGQRAVVLFRATSPGSAHNVPIATTLELKNALLGVSVDNRAAGAATAVGSGNAGLLFFAAQAGVTVEVLNNGASLPLAVSGNLTTKRITVQLRTDAGAVVQSTAEEVRTALANAGPLTFIPSLMVAVKNAGTGSLVMAITAASIALRWDGSYIQSAGADRESAARLKRRCETRLDTIGGGGGSGFPPGATGTEDALVFWGLVTPAGYEASPVSWVRVLSNNRLGSMSGGESTVVLASAAGVLSPDDVTAVTANYENPKKYWGGLSVVGASALVVTLIGVVHVRASSGKTLAEVDAAIDAALIRFRELIGEQWSRNEAPIIQVPKIIAVLSEADTGAIMWVEWTGSVLPVVLTWDQIPEFDKSGLALQFG